MAALPDEERVVGAPFQDTVGMRTYHHWLLTFFVKKEFLTMVDVERKEG